MVKRKTTFPDVVRVMAKLRAPGGCPWDRKQTHRSLLKYLNEETREVSTAVRRRDWDNLKEELGDVMLQILFHADIAAEAKRFDIYDVLAVLKNKLVRRHPHVFAKGAKDKNITAKEVYRQWQEIKAAEKRQKRKE